jgi:hypothetical protein
MNRYFFGDSYDLVKRFFCRELKSLGYVVAIDPMFTGAWGGDKRKFFRLVGVKPEAKARGISPGGVLFLDPDTGVHERGGERHVSLRRVAEEASKYEVVFSFDQSFSYGGNARAAMLKKFAILKSLGCHAMYYDSHARFLFASRGRTPLRALRAHLVSLGLPADRLVESARRESVNPSRSP